MDFCRNVSVSGGLYSEYQPEQQVLSPTSCSKLGSLDDLFSGHPLEEGDVNLEWLSIFVEDCLSSSGNCLPPTAAALAVLPPNPETAPTTSPCAPNTNSVPKNALQIVNPTQLAPQPLQKFAIPGKARSKRKRCPSVGNTPFTRRTSCWSQAPKFFTTSSTAQVQDLALSSDPPLLQQAYWLADSELILPKKDPHNSGSTSPTTTTTTPTSSSCSREYPNEKRQVIGKESRKKGKLNQEHLMMMVRVGGEREEEEEEGCHGNGGQGIRRCTHCLSHRTPQWRAGPLGPKTLCNACGVRYKSGRLLPEYRPAKSPTFVSYKHSNSHKKVLEMRSLSHLSSPSSSSS